MAHQSLTCEPPSRLNEKLLRSGLVFYSLAALNNITVLLKSLPGYWANGMLQ